MKNYLYTFLSLLIAIIFGCADAVVHYFILNDDRLELIPDDSNELWMRLIIVLLLLAFGYYADHHSRSIKEKEQEKLRLFRATVGASNHILLNYLQQMMLFKLEAMKCEDFSPEVLRMFDQIMDQTTDEIQRLASLTEVSESSIKKAVYPK